MTSLVLVQDDAKRTTTPPNICDPSDPKKISFLESFIEKVSYHLLEGWKKPIRISGATISVSPSGSYYGPIVVWSRGQKGAVIETEISDNQVRRWMDLSNPAELGTKSTWTLKESISPDFQFTLVCSAGSLAESRMISFKEIIEKVESFNPIRSFTPEFLALLDQAVDACDRRKNENVEDWAKDLTRHILKATD